MHAAPSLENLAATYGAWDDVRVVLPALRDWLTGHRGLIIAGRSIVEHIPLVMARARLAAAQILAAHLVMMGASQYNSMLVSCHVWSEWEVMDLLTNDYSVPILKISLEHLERRLQTGQPLDKAWVPE